MKAELKSPPKAMNSKTLNALITEDTPFIRRHIGPRPEQAAAMLRTLGVQSFDELVSRTVPEAIRLRKRLDLPEALSEREVLAELKRVAQKNIIRKSYIGMGFHDCITPPVVLRNILENPGWYTQYTPYQAEISQGRLEALVNFQTLIAELTGLDIANASMLDEGSAAAEAVMLANRVAGSPEKNRCFIASDCHPHVIEVVRTRAAALGIVLTVAPIESAALDESYFAALVAYPNTSGEIQNHTRFAQQVHDRKALLIADCDLLALLLLAAPGTWGADIAVGNSQRFGVPLGFGGPHAAFLAVRDELKRELPGRLVGVSKDASGNVAYRLALQTREQHIKRDRATSNICTAQVLLAIMASMYAVYHGPKGLRRIAERVHALTGVLARVLTAKGSKLRTGSFFDTIEIEVGSAEEAAVQNRCAERFINLRHVSTGVVGVSLSETTTPADLADIMYALTGDDSEQLLAAELSKRTQVIPSDLKRNDEPLKHPVFSSYQSEHEMLRYIHRLQSRDLSLTASMIPLGSCTMKLNATAEMIPVTWPEFAQIHPFAPLDQAAGYLEMISQLENYLGEITGLPGVSLQPNAGSQGEYAGLLAIRAYHEARGDNRSVCLIPASAHGTNPASAAMAGMKVVGVRCDEKGNIDLSDLEAKAKEHASALSCVMVTYPSTHGVFEESIVDICKVVHAHGGLVYMDGANMNAQVGLCRPGDFGVDVCHLNLHKTFCIPHGGGGPGIGPIAVSSALRPFLPGHFHGSLGGNKAIGPVCSAPWGSAGILAIPWTYIRLMGADGLTEATQTAILNANYLASRLESSFPVLYRGQIGCVAHECILDLRRFKRACGIDAGDVAKRLMDYSFHAPTVSFPVVETLMVEPTESESLEELDRFVEAMIAIREEIAEVESGRADSTNNLLKNAPHTAAAVCADDWRFPYSREKAAYPVQSLRLSKFWPPVSRIDAAWGDRNLFCSCAPVE